MINLYKNLLKAAFLPVLLAFSLNVAQAQETNNQNGQDNSETSNDNPGLDKCFQPGHEHFGHYKPFNNNNVVVAEVNYVSKVDSVRKITGLTNIFEKADYRVFTTFYKQTHYLFDGDTSYIATGRNYDIIVDAVVIPSQNIYQDIIYGDIEIDFRHERPVSEEEIKNVFRARGLVKE